MKIVKILNSLKYISVFLTLTCISGSYHFDAGIDSRDTTVKCPKCGRYVAHVSHIYNCQG